MVKTKATRRMLPSGCSWFPVGAIGSVTTKPPQSATESCIFIAGEYEGVRVENSRRDTQARVCQQSLRSNLVFLGDANLVATQDAVQVELRFQHDFAPGLNGPVLGRVEANGFFAAATGVEAPTGSRMKLEGFLQQGENTDLLQEALDHDVTDAADLQGAVFELETEKQYLVAGRRTLRGVLSIFFRRAGDQMAVVDGMRVSLEPMYTKDSAR